MSAPSATPARSARGALPDDARQLAARLSALFDADCAIARRLNDAQRRLRNANERLWSGLAPDAFGLIYDGTTPAGRSEIAARIDTALLASGPAAQTALLAALQEIHWQVHRAFCEYQSACEERRQLAVEVGELAVRLTEALCAAGWTPEAARSADVHQLAHGTGAGDGARESWR